MPVRRIAQGAGLYTDPSALDVPEGAMRQADNALMHRPGSIQPRPGFGDTTGVTARTTTFRPIKLVPFDGGVLVQSEDSGNYRLERLGASTVLDTANVDPPDTAIRGSSDCAESRGNLYITGSNGVRKVEDIADTATKAAGLRTDYVTPGFELATTTTNRFAIDADNQVAYRYVWVSEDANGYIRRSAPSTRWVIATASKRRVFFGRLYLPSGIVAGDKLEVYRTVGSGGVNTPPGTDLFLALTHVVTAAEVSNNYITENTIIDDINDDQLGATLYTSTSQGGIANSNELPPLANQLAEWQGCLWYANTQTRHLLPITIVSVYDKDKLDQDFTGLHYSSRTMDLVVATDIATLGTFTTSASVGQNIDGLHFGMYMWDSTVSTNPETAGTYIPANTTVKTLYTLCQLDGTLAAGTTFEIFGTTYTWNTDVTVGGSAAASATNMANLLNGLSYLGGEVTISATANSDTVTITGTWVGDANTTPVEIVGSGPGQTFHHEIEMSANALANVTGDAVQISSSITVDGTRFYAGGESTGAAGEATIAAIGSAFYSNRLFAVRTSVSGSETNVEASIVQANLIATVVNLYGIISNTSFTVRAIVDSEVSAQIVFIRTEPHLGTFTVSAGDSPHAYLPELSTTGVTSEPTRRRNRIYWSKVQEPEAVPLLNFVDIGSKERDILALVPLEDTLLVFKEDGIFKIYGTAPNGWSVDEVDLEKRLLAPESVAKMNNTAFAWTNRGVVAIREGGVVSDSISKPIENVLRESQRLLPLNEGNEKRGFYAVAHPRLGVVAFALATSTTSDTAAEWYVFHTVNGAWTRWARTDRCAAYDDAEDRMLVSTAEAAWTVLYERSDEDDADSYRDEHTGSVTVSISSSVVTVAKADIPWTPTTCDLFKEAGEPVPPATGYYAITAVVENGSDWDITVNGSPSGVTGQFVQGYEVALMWQAQHAAGIGQRWSEIHLELLDSSRALLTGWDLEVGGATHRDSSPSTVTATRSADVTYSSPVRVGCHRNLVRTPQLYPYVRQCGAGTLFRLSHVYLHHTPASRRVAR